MRSYANPFRTRTSEQVAHQGLDRYLRTFGVDALDLLPESLWDRVLVISSAPGAGKTSLLRAVSADALHVVSSRRSSFEELVDRLTQIGALDDRGEPAVIGFRVPLTRDFAGIVDLETDAAASRRMFLRLLDARIMAGFAAAARLLLDGSEPQVLTVRPEPAGRSSLDRVGGSSINAIAAWAAETEAEILDRLDSVLPPTASVAGHAAI